MESGGLEGGLDGFPGGLFSSNSSLLAGQISLDKGFGGRDVLIGEIVLFLVDPLEIALGSLIEGVPLLDDLADDFTFSEFGELGFVLIVLLP